MGPQTGPSRGSAGRGGVEWQEPVVFAVAQAAEHGGEAAQGGLGADAAGVAQGDELERDFDAGALETGCALDMISQKAPTNWMSYMGRFMCECGNSITDSIFPSDDAHYMMSETWASCDSTFIADVLKIISDNGSNPSLANELEAMYFEHIKENSKLVYSCRECGRIHIEIDKDSWNFRSHRPE